MTDTIRALHSINVLTADRPVDRVDTWMITFADLMALLLAFFVLIFSMSEFDERSWGDVVTSLSSDLMPMATSSPSEKASHAGFVQEPSTDGQTRAGYLKSLATQKFSNEMTNGALAVEVANGALLLRIPAGLDQTGLDQSLEVSLAAFFETLRDPIDIIVVRSQQADAADRIPSLVKGEAVLQQLREVGYSGDIHIYETAATVTNSSGKTTDILFSIRTGRR